MKQIRFPQVNKILKASPDMPNVKPLPVNVTGDMVSSCWKMSWRERLSALFFGRAWCQVLGRGGSHEPLALSVKRDIFPKQ